MQDERADHHPGADRKGILLRDAEDLVAAAGHQVVGCQAGYLLCMTGIRHRQAKHEKKRWDQSRHGSAPRQIRPMTMRPIKWMDQLKSK
jgi:hypothetical protein